MVEESIIKRLMTSMKCGVCGRGYEADNIFVLGHHKDLWYLRVLCSACQAQYLMAAVVKEGAESEFVTSDLTEGELDKFENAGRLTADEMLDMRIFLKTFDGDFSRLFSRGRFGVVRD